MQLDDNQNATISLEELHDILSEAISVPNPETDNYGIRVQEFFLDKKGKQNPKMVEIVERLNALQLEIMKLDSEFHDEFDGLYC